MATIRPLAKSSRKFVERAAAAAADYADAAAAAADLWLHQASAAEPNYNAGVTAGITAHAYPTGIKRVGAEKYRRGVMDKGAVRFGPGVAAAEGDWAEAFRPFQDAIAALTLPPRKPRRDPGNMARVNAVVKAMIDTAARR